MGLGCLEAEWTGLMPVKYVQNFPHYCILQQVMLSLWCQDPCSMAKTRISVLLVLTSLKMKSQTGTEKGCSRSQLQMDMCS